MWQRIKADFLPKKEKLRFLPLQKQAFKIVFFKAFQRFYDSEEVGDVLSAFDAVCEGIFF